MTDIRYGTFRSMVSTIGIVHRYIYRLRFILCYGKRSTEEKTDYNSEILHIYAVYIDTTRIKGRCNQTFGFYAWCNLLKSNQTSFTAPVRLRTPHAWSSPLRAFL